MSTTDIVPHSGNGALVAHEEPVVMSTPGPSAIAARGTNDVDEALFQEVGQELQKSGIDPRFALPPLRRWYFNHCERTNAAREQADFDHADELRATLQAEWGASYFQNIDHVNHFINTELPEPLAHAIWKGYDADGRLVANNASVMRWLLNLSGHSGVAPAPTAGALEQQIAEIEKTMRINRTAYNRDSAMQARYRQLLSLRGK